MPDKPRKGSAPNATDMAAFNARLDMLMRSLRESGGDLDTFQRIAARALADTLGVERVSIWMLAQDGAQLVCSCLVLGAEAEGREVRTIEGMADGDKLHPLQKRHC